MNDESSFPDAPLAASPPAPPPAPSLAAEFEGRETSMPRERLAALGPAALTDAELLAILLRTGTTRRNVLAVARDLLRRHGDDLSRLARASAAELRETNGVGYVRSLELAAVFELSRRVLRAAMESRPALETPEAVVRHLWPLVALDATEGFYVLPLDKKLRLCASVRRQDLCVSRGTADATPVHPRDVYREAVRANACYVIVAHNHPSGDPTPSAQDLRATRLLVEAGGVLGIPLRDSIVIGGLPPGAAEAGGEVLPRFVSLCASGAVEF